MARSEILRIAVNQRKARNVDKRKHNFLETNKLKFPFLVNGFYFEVNGVTQKLHIELFKVLSDRFLFEVSQREQFFDSLETDERNIQLASQFKRLVNKTARFRICNRCNTNFISIDFCHRRCMPCESEIKYSRDVQHDNNTIYS